MTIYLGLGANDGDRRDNLERAIAELIGAGFRLHRVSPVVESPALLPPDAEPSWHKPYLNLVVAGDADWSPSDGLATAKKIERKLGRVGGAKWSPRCIDIDILLWHDAQTAAGDLTIPHADARRRDFVLTPLMHLQPDLPVGDAGETAFELTKTIRPIPLWMGIINVSADSFSGDGDDGNTSAKRITELIENDTHLIDIGAESTRPGATVLSPDDEWKRLQPSLQSAAEQLRGRRVKPALSVDSRNPKTVAKALEYGVEVVNDVGGLSDPEMLAVVRDAGCQAVAMHSVSVPADADLCLADGESATTQIARWAEEKMEFWARNRLDLNRIILDPGIGFGKSRLQAFDLLSNCRALRVAGLRLLIGHSRKSFLAGLTDRPAADRDTETLGISLALAQQGVDIIRVHNPKIHQSAALAWAHLQGGWRQKLTATKLIR